MSEHEGGYSKTETSENASLLCSSCTCEGMIHFEHQNHRRHGHQYMCVHMCEERLGEERQRAAAKLFMCKQSSSKIQRTVALS
jgi:hypothetical protein